jgi:hypothetical protein
MLHSLHAEIDDCVVPTHLILLLQHLYRCRLCTVECADAHTVSLKCCVSQCQQSYRCTTRACWSLQ